MLSMAGHPPIAPLTRPTIRLADEVAHILRERILNVFSGPEVIDGLAARLAARHGLGAEGLTEVKD